MSLFSSFVVFFLFSILLKTSLPSRIVDNSLLLRMNYLSTYSKALHRNITCSVTLFLTVSTSIIYSQNPPNVVIIMADDLGYYDVGFNRVHRPDVGEYGIIPTPEVDRIAQDGVTCTRGYVAHPFCGPSRAALLTGRYPHEVGSQYNLQNDAVDCNGNDVGIPLGPDSEFFSKALQQQANYDTYMVGKWHVGDTQQYDPLSRGFDEYWGFLGGGHHYFPEGDASQGINNSNNIAANQNNTGINDYFKYIEKNRQWLTNESRYVTRGISEEAVNFIKQGKQSNDPFLIYVAYNAPHTPLQAPVPDINQFLSNNPNFETQVANSPDILNAKAVVEATTQAEKDAEIAALVEKRVTYAAMVTIMDEGIGQIIDELQSNADGGSVFDNTLVIFLSDNGGKLREGGGANYPLDRGKGAVNEGGFRVPMAISWPDGGIQANSNYPYPISSLDIYPTLLGVAGLAIPDRLDGEDVSNHLAASSPVLRNDPLYILRHYNGFSNVSILDNVAGSNDKVIKKANGDWQQYNVDSDIAETTNIASPSTINRLVTKVKILAKQHIQPLFFDNCGNVLTNWIDKDMPRYMDASGRPNPPDETFFLDCQGNAQDSDNDGVCDGLDLCIGNDDTIDLNANGIPDGCDTCDPALNGTACNDGDICTTGDVYDLNCNCAGTLADADNDGVCDADDICPGGNDTVDTDGDGTPDFCDVCDAALIGTSCDDGDVCTTGDVYDSNCDCAGTFADADNDGVCDALDQCANIDDALIGQSCDDGDMCTTGDVYDSNCLCAGVIADADGDGICDAQDACPNLDDALIGTLCDDGDSCTTGDQYINCICMGTPEPDADQDGVCDALDQCPNFDDALIGQPCDDGLINTMNDVYTTGCMCEGMVMPISVCVRVNNGNDDVEESGIDGTMNISSGDLDMTDGGPRGNQTIGLRFRDISVPAGAQIMNAYLQFTAEEALSGTTALMIEGDATADAPAFVNQVNNVSNRNRTLANTTWNVPAWSSIGAAGAAEQSPDISTIIQEIVDTDGYVPGNALVLIVTGSGDRTAETFEGSPTQAPELCIEYLTCTEQGIACDDGDNCTINDFEDGNCNCVGTYSGDSDGDGVCDVEDICAGGNDTVDTDGDGTPDFCDTCDNALIGTSCDDGDVCTMGDVYDSNCDCAGTFVDADNDGVCDADDICPGGNDAVDSDGDGTPDFCDTCGNAVIGTSCDDGDVCTTGDVYDSNCNCAGTLADTDNDGVCDAEDLCPGGNDSLDSDGDGIPDDCDTCDMISNEDFESNSSAFWTTGGFDAAIVASSNSPEGGYSFRIRDNSFASSSISSPVLDLSSVESIQLTFDYQAIGMEAGEDFFLELSTDGGITYAILEEWNSGVEFFNGIVYNEDISISNNNLSTQTIIRFRCDASINSDEVYLDNIIIETCVPDSDCVDVIVNNDNSLFSSSLRAVLEIKSNNIIPAGVDIEFSAGQSVELLSGFEVKSTAVFHAFIESCQ